MVGLGGDRLACHGGRLWRNGTAADEPYLAAGTVSGCREVRVPAGTVYVMGDNRPGSADSRSFGPLRRSEVVGRLLLAG